MTRSLILLMAALQVLVPADSMAEWTLINQESNVLQGSPLHDAVYVDLASIKHQGDTVRFWVLYDFSSVNFAGYQSTKIDELLNCSHKTVTSLSVAHYAGQMGKGRLLSSSGKQQELQVIDQDQLFWKIFCES